MNIFSKLKIFTFVSLAFAIPFSVALTNILIVLFSFFWIIEGGFKNKFNIIISHKWLISIFTLIILYFIGLLYGESHGDAQYVLKRALLLLFFVPVIASNFSEDIYRKSVKFFLAANLFSALAAIAINFSVIDSFFSTPSISAFLKYNYHNILLSFSSLLAFILFVRSKSRYAYTYLILILIYTMSIFTEAGRAGQLTFNLFFFLFSIYYIKKNFKYSLSIISFLFIVNYLSYSNSPIFKYRVDNLSHIVQNDGKKKNVKAKEKDIRYLFTKSGLELALKKPIFGYGTGSFSEVFKEYTNTTYDLNKHKTPHNNYLYVLLELGLIGLITFLSIFYYQIKNLLLIGEKNFEILLLPIFILVLMLFDSYMFIFTLTIFYIYMYKVLSNILIKSNYD